MWTVRLQRILEWISANEAELLSRYVSSALFRRPSRSRTFCWSQELTSSASTLRAEIS